MTDPVVLHAGAATIRVAGVSLIAVYGGVLSAYIVNPFAAADQGLLATEVLYVDPTGPATLNASDTTIALAPGQGYVVPAGQTTPIWVNAASAGHSFSVILAQSPPSPPTPFPITTLTSGELTTLSNTIPSYLYQEYSDDEDLQAFVASFNSIAQSYVNTLNALNLPIYTGLQGGLLDWVGSGLYGMPRPAISSGRSTNVGPLDTYKLNVLRLNHYDKSGPINEISTSDDIYKRILTWHLFKGDGKVFNIRWLKRRIMRFLLGTNGVNFNVDQTYQVSVSFGTDNEATITFVTGVRTVTGGAFCDRNQFNAVRFNELDSTFRSINPLPNVSILQEAIASGALELPFQINFVVVSS